MNITSAKNSVVGSSDAPSGTRKKSALSKFSDAEVQDDPSTLPPVLRVVKDENGLALESVPEAEIPRGQGARLAYLNKIVRKGCEEVSRTCLFEIAAGAALLRMRRDKSYKNKFPNLP